MGGALEICIKMRAPLIKADIVKTTEKWLVVTFGNASSPEKEQPKQPEPQKLTSPPEPLPDMTIEPAKKSPPSSPKTQKIPIDDDLESRFLK